MKKSDDSDPGDSKEPNPLDAEGDSQTKASVDEPEPPAWGKSLGWSLFMLVVEGVEGERSETGCGDERRVKEDKSCLGEQSVLYVNVSSVATARASLLSGLPKMMSPAPMTAVMVRHPRALRVRNMKGAKKTPQMAGNMRMATYGTPGSM